MTHMQFAGNIGWSDTGNEFLNQLAMSRLKGQFIRIKKAALFPELIDAVFSCFWVVGLGDFFHISILAQFPISVGFDFLPAQFYAFSF